MGNYKVTGGFSLEIEDVENEAEAKQAALDQLGDCFLHYPLETALDVKAEEQVELTPKQIEQIDAMDNAIHALVCQFAQQDIEWDMELIGEISDTIENYVCHTLELMTEMEFRPYCAR